MFLQTYGFKNLLLLVPIVLDISNGVDYTDKQNTIGCRWLDEGLVQPPKMHLIISQDPWSVSFLYWLDYHMTSLPYMYIVYVIG